MGARLTYVIQFVADMDKAITFYRDTLGLAPRFATPFWTELVTGDTTLALHPASDANPAGKVQIGFGVDDLAAFHAEQTAAGVTFTQPPREQHGVMIAALLNSEGAEIRVSG